MGIGIIALALSAAAPRIDGSVAVDKVEALILMQVHALQLPPEESNFKSVSNTDAAWLVTTRGVQNGQLGHSMYADHRNHGSKQKHHLRTNPHSVRLSRSKALSRKKNMDQDEDFRLPVDILPDRARMTHQNYTGVVPQLLAPSYQYGRFRRIEFARRLLEERTPKGIFHSCPGVVIGFAWPAGFFAAMIALALLTRLFCNKFKISSPVFDERLSLERGRPIWTYCCAILVFGLSTAVFWISVFSIEMVNKDIAKHPQIREPSQEGVVIVTRNPIKEPGRGGFEAGQGVFLSVVVGCVLSFAWRWRGRVRISASLLAYFSLRGSTFALAMAIMLELIGEIVLMNTGIDADKGWTVGNAIMMLIVGVSEEGTKLFAVLFGTWISAAAVANSSQDRKKWTVCFRILVESPRALMLAGLAVGFGFMINENAEYMIAVVSTPTMQYSTEDADDQLGGTSTYLVVSVVTICIRVFLNNHPWWAALSAARIGRVLFNHQRNTAWPTVIEFMVAIGPSAVAHASYDFLVGSGPPTLIALAIPAVFWFGARWGFMAAWDSYSDGRRDGGVLIASSNADKHVRLNRKRNVPDAR